MIARRLLMFILLCPRQLCHGMAHDVLLRNINFMRRRGAHHREATS